MTRTSRIVHAAALAAAVAVPGAALGWLTLAQFSRPAELLVELPIIS